MKVAYNITFVVEADLADDWRQWIKSTYLPKLMESDCFREYRFHKLIGLPKQESPTYSLQLIADNKINIKRYQDQFEVDHINLTSECFKDRVLEFRTLMVIIDVG